MMMILGSFLRLKLILISNALEPENINKYSRFVSSLQRKESASFDYKAVAQVINYSRRLAEHKHKLSTRFNDIVEILYEADAWAELILQI